MDNFSITIFGNKILLEIIRQMRIFSNFTTKYYEDLDLCLSEAERENQLVVFFMKEVNKNFINKIKQTSFPLIVIKDFSNKKITLPGDLNEILNTPFKILEFKKKITFLNAKNQFKRNSIIHLSGYVIDKNERKIKKNNLELQLSEKEIDFLILFSQNTKPITRNIVLKKVWNYSPNSETHTVETHIHRLRKKILEKFNDSNFVKNNNKGYYI